MPGADCGSDHNLLIEGWEGEGGRRGFRIGDTCTPMADSSQYMVKKKNKKKKKKKPKQAKQKTKNNYNTVK